jgi:DNA-binding FadR family transcriptional regulator
VEALAGLLAAEREAAQEAIRLTGAELCTMPGEAASFCMAVISRVAGAAPALAVPNRAGLAQTIADRIEADLEQWVGHSASDRSGVLDAMSEQYGVSLPLVVQAVRLLEDGGLVQMNKGRSGGIQITSDRSSARAIRIAHAYFSTNGVSLAECDKLVRLLNIVLIQQAIGKGVGGTAAVEEALASMLAAGDPTNVGMHWYSLQRALSNRAANTVLHLLVRCFAAYLVRVRTCRAQLNRAQAAALIAASERIVGGVRSGRADGSAEAHLECQLALGASW